MPAAFHKDVEILSCLLYQRECWSQYAIADLLGVSQPTVLKYVNPAFKSGQIEYRQEHIGAKREYDKAYCQANAEKRRFYDKQYQKEHPEKSRLRMRRWRLLNPDKASDSWRKWASTAAGKAWHKNKAHMRRQQIQGGNGVSPSELTSLWGKQSGLCAYCGTAMVCEGSQYQPTYATIDHVFPLSKGGKHEIDNVVWACRLCNIKKHDKVLEPQ